MAAAAGPGWPSPGSPDGTSASSARASSCAASPSGSAASSSLTFGGTGTSWLDPLHDVGVELINGLKHGLDERPITLPAGFGADGQPPPGEGNVDLADACREMARRYRTMDPRP